jgi:single-strand DNA-binding protein
MNSNITIIGNLTRDPELTFLNSGQPTVKLGVAVNRRWQNKKTQEWEEKVSFFNVVCYGKLADNIATSLPKGTRVIVTGRLEQREWQTENGEKRSVIEITADDIGASLYSAHVSITRNAASISAGAPEEYAF